MVGQARQCPAAAPFLIWDTKQAGLVLRVQPTGHRSWYCVYRHHARPRWHRLGNVDDVARMALMLCSDEASYLMGSTVYVDGGMMLYPAFERVG